MQFFCYPDNTNTIKLRNMRCILISVLSRKNNHILCFILYSLCVWIWTYSREVLKFAFINCFLISKHNIHLDKIQFYHKKEFQGFNPYYGLIFWYNHFYLFYNILYHFKPNHVQSLIKIHLMNQSILDILINQNFQDFIIATTNNIEIRDSGISFLADCRWYGCLLWLSTEHCITQDNDALGNNQICKRDHGFWKHVSYHLVMVTELAALLVHKTY